MSLAFKNDYLYHAHMLADQTRLRAYRHALAEQMRTGEAVVEIGSGTGILSLIAADLGAGKADAVEYFADLCDLSRANAEDSSGPQPNFHRASSYAWRAAAPVHGLFSETIGSWGPEENIVEIFADFMIRHPEVRWLVPSRLALFAQEVRTSVVDRDRQLLRQACATAAEVSGRPFRRVEAELELAYTDQIQCTVFSPGDFEGVAAPRELQAYELGLRKSSRFQTTYRFTDGSANALHLYFVAQLSASVLLSSHAEAPPTHWRHLYLPRPNGMNQVQISYDPGTRRFSFLWQA